MITQSIHAKETIESIANISNFIYIKIAALIHIFIINFQSLLKR